MKFLGKLFNGKSSPEAKVAKCLSEIEALLEEVNPAGAMVCSPEISNIRQKIS